MIKKRLIVALLATLCVMAANPMRTVNLTVINKSEVDIGLYLGSETDDDRWYYFTIPSGYPDEPKVGDDWYTEKTFEIVWDIYSGYAYFIEPYDPVYGYPLCGNKTQGIRLNATHNVKIVYRPCKNYTFRPGSYHRDFGPKYPKYLPK